MLKKIAIILEMIKFQHTVFALPFAVVSAFLAAGGAPAAGQICWILAAMVAARSCAMAFNRVVDEEHDAKNPRTADRALPKGLITRRAVWLFILVTAALFVLSAGMLSVLCLYLSPLALLIILGYSYAKRFTALSHFWLGLSLAIAPVGAWLAIRGEVISDGQLPFVPALLGIAVLFWTAGFDIIYSCQDIEFDAAHGLRSMPQSIGMRKSLWLSRFSHFVTMIALALLVPFGGFGAIYVIGLAVIAALLIYEHRLVSPCDLSKVNVAFFTVNGYVSLGLMFIIFADVLI